MYAAFSPAISQPHFVIPFEFNRSVFCFVYMDWYLRLILLILVSVHIEGDYIKNQCRSDNTSCIPCSQRFPSCVGHPDGNNLVIGHYWSADYLICLRNRTISVNKCQSGLFDPVNRRCTLIVDISKLYLVIILVLIKAFI